MRKLFFILLCLLFSSVMYAQMVLHDPVSARTFNTQKYTDIKGSPFLIDKWIKGSVVTDKGTYDNLELKLDVYDNTLYFNKDGEALEFRDKVESFILKPLEIDSASFLAFKRGLSGKVLRPDEYVQVLAEGKLNVYKQDKRLLSEINEINRGTIKSFTPVTKYYVVKDGEWKQLRLNKKEAFELMDDKIEKVKAYINDNKLGLKNERDWVAVFAYYNKL